MSPSPGPVDHPCNNTYATVGFMQRFSRQGRLVDVGRSRLNAPHAQRNGVTMCEKVERRPGLRSATGLFLGLMIALAACGNTNAGPNASVPRGFITGTADMCSGAPGEPPHNVQARLLQGKRLVGQKTYLGNHMFRFSVDPGRYTVTSDQSYATPVQVTVRAGQTVHVEVYSSCS